MSQEENVNKLRIHLLGTDSSLLGSVQGRINRFRPVEALSFYNLKEFIQKSMLNQPDFLALSLNYGHPHILQLPLVLSQILQKKVIVFIEKDDGRSRALVNECKSELVIHSVLSAHNLWMKISQASGGAEEEDYKKVGSKSNHGQESRDTLVFRGQQTLTHEQKQMMDSLGYLLKDTGDETPENANFFYDPENGQSDATSPAADDQKSSSSQQELGVINSHDAESSATTEYKDKTQQSSNQSQETNIEGQNNTISNEASDTNKKQERSPHSKGSSESGVSFPERQSQSLESPNFTKDNVNKNYKKTQDTLSDSSPQQVEVLSKEMDRGHSHEVELLELSRQALPQLPVEKFSKNNKQSLYCFMVYANQVQGCLFLRVKSGANLDNFWFRSFHKNLAQLLEGQGYNAQLMPYQGEVQASLVESHLSKTDYFRNEQQDGDPVFHFCDYQYNEPDLDIDPDVGMISLKVDQIRPNKKVYFEMFLYLPKNKKMVSYLKKEGELSIEQFSRLKANNNTALFVDPKDSESLRKYLFESSVEMALSEQSQSEKPINSIKKIA